MDSFDLETVACNTTIDCVQSKILNALCVDFVCKCAKGMELSYNHKVCIPKIINDLLRMFNRKVGEKCSQIYQCQSNLYCSDNVCKSLTSYIETTTHRTLMIKPTTANCNDGYHWSYTHNGCIPIRRNYDSLMITVLGLIFFIVVTVICTNITNKSRDRGDEDEGEYPIGSENAASYTFDAPLPQFNERNAAIPRIEAVKDDDSPPSYEEAIASEPPCPTFIEVTR